MIENSKNILEKARANKYAVPQFNINNLEWTKYIIEECQANNSPVILGVSEGAVKYMGGYNTVVSLVKGLVMDLKPSIPIVIHLDHGSTVDSCKKAIDAGFTSVMIDASKCDLDTNIAQTKEVMNYASLKGVTVEAEVGHIGGVEDNMSSSVAYANIDDVAKLIKETNVDSFAPALGSVHGMYKGEANLNFELMIEINKLISTPLVLHGGSGIADDTIKKAIECGITKLNINTDLQVVWHDAVYRFMNGNPNIYDPRKIIGSGEIAIKTDVKAKLNLLGSINKDN